jgi:hypothetical protein
MIIQMSQVTILLQLSGQITTSTPVIFTAQWNSNPNVDKDLWLVNPLFINNYWNNAEDFGDFGLRENSPGRNSGI